MSTYRIVIKDRCTRTTVQICWEASSQMEALIQLGREFNLDRFFIYMTERRQ